MGDNSVKTASCYCGSVRLEFNAEPTAQYLCDCIFCKKRTGSAFAAQVLFPASSLKITAGQDAIAKTSKCAEEGGEPLATAHFCAECHSPLYTRLAFMPDTSIVPMGLLDDSSFFRPQKEYFTKRRCGWLTELEGAEQFVEMKF